MDLTLLELSLEDATITANAPFSGRGSAESDDVGADGTAEPGDDTAGEAAEDASGWPVSATAVVVGILAILVVVAVLKRRRGGDEAIEVE